jgi:hypothetical protein
MCSLEGNAFKADDWVAIFRAIAKNRGTALSRFSGVPLWMFPELLGINIMMMSSDYPLDTAMEDDCHSILAYVRKARIREAQLDSIVKSARGGQRPRKDAY